MARKGVKEGVGGAIEMGGTKKGGGERVRDREVCD